MSTPESVESFVFHGAPMTVRLSTVAAGGAYCLIEMQHPPGVGPSLHVHPTHPESFFVLEGGYAFHLDGRIQEVGPGAAISVPPGTPHRYKSGPAGGRVLVIAPPNLENYFATVAHTAKTKEVTMEEEMAIASRYGQHFLEMSGHW